MTRPAQKMRKIVTCEEERVKAECAEQCGRGMVNFRKAFKRDSARALHRRGGVPRVRRHAEHPEDPAPPGQRAGPVPPRRHRWNASAGSGRTRCSRSAPPRPRTACGSSGITSDGRAVRARWPSGSSVPCTREFKAIRKEAERMCQQFDARFPDAGEPVCRSSTSEPEPKPNEP